MLQELEAAWNEGAALGDQDKVDPNTGRPLQVPPMVSVNSWDNHAVHIEVHNRFRKSQAFQLLPEVVRAEFQKHIALHEQTLAEAQMAQLQMQQIAAPQTSQAGAVEAPLQSGMTEEQLG